MQPTPIDAAQIGKMFVTKIVFQFHAEAKPYNNTTNKYELVPAHWEISAMLAEKPQAYGDQTMSFKVEQGIGQKLAEILLPVVVADASRKAQQLADDSKAMLAALGERTVACLADMPAAE